MYKLKLVKETPNDRELGSRYRSYILTQPKLDELCLKTPNDIDLGKKLRKKFGSL